MGEYIVFACKDHYNPVGIVRTLGEANIRPIVVVVKTDPQLATKSKYVKKAYIVNSPEEGLRLIISKFAKSVNDKSFILTGDDVTVSLLDNHYDELIDYFYFYNAGAKGAISHYMNKDVLNALAIKHGFCVAKTWKVKPCKESIPDDITYPIITKALNSFGDEWKDIVYVCNDQKELLLAFSNIKSEYILLQEYIEKSDEYGYEGLSINKGKDSFVSMQTSQVYDIEGQYSPYWYAKNVNDLELISHISDMIAEIGLEGVWEFEFLVDKNGKLYFLEINFRNTVIGWATTIAGMPSITLWCQSMQNGIIPDNIIRSIPDNFTIMAECFDYDARVKTGIIKKTEWLRQYKEANAKLYKGRNDYMPFFSFMWYKYTKMRRE